MYFSPSLSYVYAQEESGGHNALFETSDVCLSDVQRTSIKYLLKQNIKSLRKSGKLPKSFSRAGHPLFIVPVQQKQGLNDYGFYAISNYVDQDTGSDTKDYNCGQRTYDGHRGTDYFLWPFPWHKMDNDDVEVIAAADGIIIGKVDGNTDENCDLFGTKEWNAIFLQHEDGSTSWYGHFKKGSISKKEVGESVVAGRIFGYSR